MATWLPLLTAGPYTITVKRDGMTVTDLEEVGASLSVVGGLVHLITPDDEWHEWEAQVTGNGLLSSAPVRIRSIIVEHPDATLTAEAVSLLDGIATASQSLIISEPNASPDPAAPGSGNGVSLQVVEQEPA